MARIGSKNTLPELAVRSVLYELGLRYRIHDKTLPGKPDVCIKKYNLVVDVKGCFWHGHKNCKFSSRPKTNTDFWLSKIRNNAERDARNQSLLQELGYRVYTIWECETKDIAKLNNRIDSIECYVKECRGG